MSVSRICAVLRLKSECEVLDSVYMINKCNDQKYFWVRFILYMSVIPS